jgi:cytochrome b561
MWASGSRVTSAQEDYTATAKLLHWLIAAFIVALLAIGLTMTRIQDLQLRFELYQLHKSLGVTVLGLMILRLGWRLAVRPPELPARMSGIERAAARQTHLALYVLLLALPLSGWAMVSAALPPFNFPTMLYKTIPWPHIPAIEEMSGETKKTVEPFLKTLHAALGWALLALVALHVAAAMRHTIVLRDGVMLRMLPRFLKSSHLLVACLAFGALGAGSAGAQEWAVDKARSKITFEVDAGGQTVTGEFEQFQAEIHFDPDYPNMAEVSAAIDVNTVTTGQSQVDGALLGKDWFDAQTSPAAGFRAKSIKPAGGNGGYVLEGNLSIKGETAPISMPFTLKVKEGEATVRGTTTIKRNACGPGPSGPVSGMAIGNIVTVKLDLAATRLDN